MPISHRGARPDSLARLAANVALAAAALAPVGCRAPETPAISRQEFVDAYMALVRARVDAEGDERAYALARDRALQRLGVTAEELRGFVAAGREDPEDLQLAWQAIAARMDTLYGGVTEPPPELRGGLGAGLRDAAEEPAADSTDAAARPPSPAPGAGPPPADP